MLKTLKAEGLSLVELGGYGKIRVLRFPDSVFNTEPLPEHAFPIGVSRSGGEILTSVSSGHNPYSQRGRDEVDIATLGGLTVATIHPSVRGMTAITAELSPDRSMVAFVGSFTRPTDTSPVYGLHLLSITGEIRTLVPSSEAKVPQSIGWSADGRAIVYDASRQVLMYHLDSNTSTVLTQGDHPTWSPNGSWIAFRRTDGTACLVTPDGGYSKTIIGGARIYWALQWSPDSRFLLFTDSGGIKVVDLTNDRTATIYKPLDQYTEARLRWLHE